MAKYCDKECEEMGSLCDYCIYYKDDLEGVEGKFAGEGLCIKKDIRVDAYDSCADDFHCTLVEDNPFTELLPNNVIKKTC